MRTPATPCRLIPPRSIVLFAIFATCLVASPILAQSRQDRVRSLAEHAIEVRSIDPGDEDFSDLEPLRELFASSRVVLLGEQSHGDGATFMAKARLVRFLHQEMGFDVLAFESGFFECQEVEARVEAGESVAEALPSCVFPIWTQSAQFAPTMEYLQGTRDGDRPLRIAGFDSQMTGITSERFLAAGLREVADAVDSGFDWGAHGELLRDLTWNRVGMGRSDLPAEADRRALDQALIALVGEITESIHRDGSFWAQVARSLRAQLATVHAMDGAMSTVESVIIRDRQMAENFEWLLDEGFPDARIIVWAHTGHVARSLDAIESGSAETDDFYDRWRPMGSFLADRLGDRMYTLGFIADEGEWGLPYGGQSVPLEAADEDSIEGLLADTELDFALVDLRGVGRAGNEPMDGAVEWLREPLESRPISYEPMTADWGEVVDGLFFTRVMTPSTPVEP